MLSEVSVKRQVSQAPLKKTVCHAGCGAVVQFRTNPKVICDACKPEWRRRQVAVSVEKQRRKRGVPEIKGTIIACARCGVQVTLNRSANAKFCSTCAVEASRDRARERVRKACRDRNAPKVGAQDACRRCGETFTRSGARHYLCSPCGDMAVRMQFPEQAEKQKAYAREWRKQPHARMLERASQKRSRDRRRTDPAFSINERMSAGVRYSIGRKKNGSSWESLVGYSCVELMTHLEKQFTRGMTWDNRGDWEIDHIVPLAAHTFKSPDDPEFKAAWGITNLRPLWREENNHKRARRTHLL